MMLRYCVVYYCIQWARRLQCDSQGDSSTTWWSCV